MESLSYPQKDIARLGEPERESPGLCDRIARVSGQRGSEKRLNFFKKPVDIYRSIIILLRGKGQCPFLRRH